MTRRRLLLLRHGRTDWNHSKRLQGQSDSMLDEVGHTQARAAAKEIAALRPVLLVSSDLARARDTAAYVAEATSLEVAYDARLREFSLGDREGLTHEEYVASHPEEFERFLAGDWDSIPGAEPRQVVADRTRAVLGETLASLQPGETGVAVSHGAAIRVAISALLGWGADALGTLAPLANGAWAVLAEAGDHGPDRRLRLAAYGALPPDFVP